MFVRLYLNIFQFVKVVFTHYLDTYLNFHNFLTGTIPLFVACIVLIAIWWISAMKNRRLRTQMNQSEDLQYTEIYEKIDDQIVLVTKRI